MIRITRFQAGALAALGASALLAGCAAKAPPPPPPPPPPPVVVVIPPKPAPPRGAAPGMAVPAIGPDGVRQTINAHLSAAQTTWHLRSALNVAALNCLSANDMEILAGYKILLKTHAKALTAANRAIDSEFKAKYGEAWLRPRETYMTQVYNYFALPPTRIEFCTAARTIASQIKTVKKGELDAFAGRSLPQLETIYEGFYRDYDKYRGALASWEAQYAPYLASGTAAPAPAPTTVTVPALSPAPVAGTYGPAESPKR